ncbi:sugar phosphate isomerase/epimerase family protein [Jeotgalibacillus proteolyticus]|uniref:Sugar phosphate isomerase/epimerase n=1 Tax=Jeotgalibacillus proteolyticus TaxID=2082395 RepID=A0A2S5GAA3_9BACL|nr:sugar phosphate isomerase/epimerase [Jeotgalibacillus proteolyticus]PPA69843.1 sugar phosphate isomerase/epimerase [Jeotgalibacillus proteolyticus]
MKKIGLQLYSVRDAMEKDVAGTLKTLSEYGYEGVQLAGTYEKDAEQWKSMLGEYGLQAAGMHISVDLLSDEALLDEWIEFSKVIGNKKLIIPYVDEQWRTKEKFEELAELLNKASRKVEAAGLALGYHHHDFEFAELENGETGWGILERLTSNYPVFFEVDVYWTEFSGVDTVELLKRLEDRVFSIHIKDMISDGGERRSGPIGTGTLDLKGIIKQVSLDWLVVEQEHFEGEPLEEVGPAPAVLREWTGG